MSTLSLETALRTGSFAGLRPGAATSEVLELLGPPDAVGGQSRKNPRGTVWKYGDAEVGFTMPAQVLRYVRLAGWGPTGPELGRSLVLDRWWLDGPVTLPRFGARMEQAGLACEEVPAHDPKLRILRLSSGVQAYFEIRPGAPAPLLSTLYFGLA